MVKKNKNKKVRMRKRPRYGTRINKRNVKSNINKQPVKVNVTSQPSVPTRSGIHFLQPPQTVQHRILS